MSIGYVGTFLQVQCMLKVGPARGPRILAARSWLYHEAKSHGEMP